MKQPTTVVAAGALLERFTPQGRTVLVVHRPRYDDWSFPKGKLDLGETIEECARREVLEETGLVAVLGERLADTEYVDRKGRPKIVHWWRGTVVSGTFAPNDEVDEVRWVTPDEARSLLSYPRDADLLGSDADVLGSDADLLGSDADVLGSDADVLGSDADPTAPTGAP